jgi:flagellar motor switch protein FliG
MPLSGREKATIFLSILGAETSARVLRYLPDELADLIAAGINHLPTPSPEALKEVLGDFKGFLALPGGGATAPRLEGKPMARPAAPKKSYAVLRYERPQTAAFLISLLPEGEREDALASLPRERGTVEELLYSLKKTPLSPKIESELKEQYTGRLF